MREIAPGVVEHGNESVPVPDRSLTAREFLSLLTVEEEAAIERAAADISNGNPNARLAQAKHRVRLRRITAAGRLSRDDPAVVEFLAGAQADGLLTQQRVSEILA